MEQPAFRVPPLIPQHSGDEEGKGNRNRCRRRGSLRMNHNGRAVPVECGVGQIDVRQNHDDQHEHKHAAQDPSCRRLYLPARHEPA